MKLHLSKPSLTLPKFLKHWSLKLVVSVLLIAAVVALGVVETYKYNQAQAHREALTAQAQQARDTSYQKQIDALTAQNKSLQANVTASCSYLKELNTAKATKFSTTTPTASGCSILKP